MTVVATAFAVVLALWVALLYVPFRWRPVGIYLFVPKVLAVGHVPLLAVAGTALAVVGFVAGSWPIALPAGVAAAGAITAAVRTGAASTDLSGALGPHRGERADGTVGRRGRRAPEPRVDRDVPFATVPGTDRTLLCDLWQPAAGVPPSGVAVVYLHGSAYYFLDKDLGTRPMFRSLTARGHVVVDVAYRLFPETDVPGMVSDAKRAIAWVRSRSAELGVDPERIVVAGGSSGGHLALLAAYTDDDPAFTPAELTGHDLRVRAVVSLYGQVSLEALYAHAGQDKQCHPDDPQPDWTAPPPPALRRLFGADATRLRLGLMTCAGRCDWLVGGTPEQVPERYEQVSALRHVARGCPPTLLLHGTHDEMAPVGAVRELEQALERAGVPVGAVYLPHTDHMFDLVGTRWSPAARASFRTLERFLDGVAVEGPHPGHRHHRQEQS